MCSITTNATVDQQLEHLELSNNRQMIEKRLIDFAREASPECRGALDVAGMHGFPADLKEVRKKQIGRHRVYYTGFHKQCNYHTFYIKEFKRTGVDDDSDRHFQNRLRSALSLPPTRRLT